jgi:hypothetical protein
MWISKRASLTLCAVVLTLGSSTNYPNAARSGSDHATASPAAASSVQSPSPPRPDGSVDIWLMLAMGVGLIALQLRRKQRESRNLRIVG